MDSEDESRPWNAHDRRRSVGKRSRVVDKADVAKYRMECNAEREYFFKELYRLCALRAGGTDVCIRVKPWVWSENALRFRHSMR